jgi:hypothetical protein
LVHSYHVHCRLGTKTTQFFRARCIDTKS